MAEETKCFADTVISKIVNQMSEGKTVTDKDCALVRNVFRKAGGSWERIVLGDVDHIRLLKETIKVWVTRHASNS